MEAILKSLSGWARPLWDASLETMYMVSLSTLFSLVVGFGLSILMIIAHPHGLRPLPGLYRTLDGVVNLFRSFPAIILLIVIQPFTRMVAGTTLGSTAAIVPLTVAAAPFAARLLEGCFLEVDRGVIEAARSCGARNLQIIFRVLVPEALPSIVLNVAVLAITLLGYSAISGSLGGGGLGALAIMYGYNRFQWDVMLYAVVILLIMVQAMQSAGSYLYRKFR